MISSAALSPVAISTMRGTRKNRIGTAEWEIGIVRQVHLNHDGSKLTCLLSIVLTPTDYGNTDNQLGCYSSEDNDQFLEH